MWMAGVMRTYVTSDSIRRVLERLVVLSLSLQSQEHRSASTSTEVYSSTQDIEKDHLTHSITYYGMFEGSL